MTGPALNTDPSAAAGESQLATLLHQAAVDVSAAHTAGDVVAETAARQRLKQLSDAYLSRGKTDDELEAAKAGGPIAQTLDALTGLVKSAAGLVVILVLLFLWAPWRRR